MTQKNYKTKNRKLDLRRYKLHILFIVTTYFSFFFPDPISIFFYFFIVYISSIFTDTILQIKK